jgi:hypothetical protein
MKKRILATFLCFVLLVGLIPTTALAEDPVYSVSVTVTETGKLAETVTEALSDGKTVADITSLTITTADGVYINNADCEWVKSTLRSAKTSSEESAPGKLTRLDISQADFIDDSGKQSGQYCGTSTSETYLHRIPYEAFRGVGLTEVLPFSGTGASTAGPSSRKLATGHSAGIT